MGFPDRDAGAVEILFEVVDRVGAVVKDGSRERGVGFAFGENAAKCSGLPAPPEAITGMCVARETARVSAQSKPV